MSTIADRCLQLIARQKAIPVETLTPEQTLEELHFDSLDKVTLVFDIEEEFHIAITDAKLASLRTIGDVIEGIEQETKLRGESA